MARVKSIAVAGKGGVGKTTFTALLLKYLVHMKYLTHMKKPTSILAVDADPNANLGEALGLSFETTVSQLLDETKDPKAIPQGMTKDIFVEYRLQQCLTESEHIDLLVMGGPQGAGCYCYPNDLLCKHLLAIGGAYDYVIVDSEAGLEHLSRRTVPEMDEMFVISDASVRGVRSAGRVYELIRSIKTPVKSVYLVLSKTTEGSLASLSPEIESTGLTLLGSIPLDPLVVEYDLAGKPLYNLPENAPSVQAIAGIFRESGIFD